MKTSILIPSLFRHALLTSTIQSFLSNASNPNDVEIMVRLHAKDSASIRASEKFQKQVRVVIGDDMLGYLSMSNFCNCLAACATGDWLFPASDDAPMITAGWDTVLNDLGKDPLRDCCVVNSKILNNGRDGRLPFISRRLYQVLGHVGQTPHLDCYLDALANLFDISIPAEIVLSNLSNPNPPEPRNLRVGWDIMRSSVSEFQLDKIKLGAAIGKTPSEWSIDGFGELKVTSNGEKADMT